MDTLQFFNTGDNNYNDLLENVLRDEITKNDQQTVDHVEKTILTLINTRLDHANTQCQGLNLLSNFAYKISKDNLTKFFPNWMTKVINILNNKHSTSDELITVCKVIKALIVNCKEISEIDKRISINFVKQIIGIIRQQYFESKNDGLLHLLIILIYYYPESCVRFQESIASIVSSCIDEKKNSLAQSGAKCYSLLIRAMERPFIQFSKNHPSILLDNNSVNCHIFYQINICNNLHSIMNELFKDFITANLEIPYSLQDFINMSVLQLPDIPYDDILEYYSAMERRFTNLCTYLCTSLTVGGVAEKKYASPNILLQIISQGLSITPSNVIQNNEGNRKDFLLLILPKLHIGLLNIFEALIINFQQELLVFGLFIQRLILQILEWTQQFEQESYKSIRIFAYKILTTWLKQTKSLSGFQIIADEFLIHLLKDISLTKTNVLVLKTKGNKKFKKDNSNSQDLNESQNLENGSDFNSISYKHPGVCLQALLTLQSIISSSNYFLKQSFYEQIQNSIVILLYEQYVNKNSISVSKVNIEYRLQLVRTLRILETYAHNLAPSPTSYAIQIFGIVISQDNNPEIIEEATHGLAEVRYIVNPTAPSLMVSLNNCSDTE